MTITEYVAKFTELACFALTIVPTDNVRKRKFMLGLRVEIPKQIDSGSHGPESYVDAIQRALRNKSWDRGEPRMAPSKVEIIHETKSTPNKAKKSFGASTGGSRNNERYNPRKRKFSQGNDRNRVENRGSETRWSRNSENGTPTGERVQNAPQILENRTATILPCTLCKRIHSG